nr:hypothetical protein [uncultured Cellulosilyticum sp.]
MHSKKFPKYFPDGCPPEDTIKEELNVYRIAKYMPINIKDFETHFIKFPGRFDDDLRAYGLSVYEDIESLEKCRKKIPALKKCKKIYMATTKEEYGKIKRTPNDFGKHITWWLYEDTNPLEIFDLYKEGRDNGE